MQVAEDAAVLLGSLGAVGILEVIEHIVDLLLAGRGDDRSFLQCTLLELLTDLLGAGFHQLLALRVALLLFGSRCGLLHIGRELVGNLDMRDLALRRLCGSRDAALAFAADVVDLCRTAVGIGCGQGAFIQTVMHPDGGILRACAGKMAGRLRLYNLFELRCRDALLDRLRRAAIALIHILRDDLGAACSLLTGRLLLCRGTLLLTDLLDQVIQQIVDLFAHDYKLLCSLTRLRRRVCGLRSLRFI